jgi:hypothetical protein
MVSAMKEWRLCGRCSAEKRYFGRIIENPIIDTPINNNRYIRKRMIRLGYSETQGKTT